MKEVVIPSLLVFGLGMWITKKLFYRKDLEKSEELSSLMKEHMALSKELENLKKESK